MIPKTFNIFSGSYYHPKYYDEHSLMHLNCKTLLNRNAVLINFKRNDKSYKNVRDSNYYERNSSNAIKTLIISVYREIDSNKESMSYLNYSCFANFGNLDVFPYAFVSEIGTFTHPVSEQSMNFAYIN
jgi:hypothetical protein